MNHHTGHNHQREGQHLGSPQPTNDQRHRSGDTLPNTTGTPTSTGRAQIHTQGRRRTEVIRSSRQPPPTPPRPPTTSAALRPRDRSAKLERQADRGRQLPQTTAKLASGAVTCDENHPRHLVRTEWSPGTDTQQRATATPCRSEKLDHRHHHPWSRLELIVGGCMDVAVQMN
jgi:hypothetical protein